MKKTKRGIFMKHRVYTLCPQKSIPDIFDRNLNKD